MAVSRTRRKVPVSSVSWAAMSRVACGITTVKHARLALDAANPNSFYVAGVVGRPDGLMADPAPCQAEVLGSRLHSRSDPGWTRARAARAHAARLSTGRKCGVAAGTSRSGT